MVAAVHVVALQVRDTKVKKLESGGHVSPKFEGGQMPLYRRLPKRGFNNYNFAQIVEIVNIQQLNDIFEQGARIDKVALFEQGLIKAKARGNSIVKVLGNGTLSKKLIVIADAFSSLHSKL